MMNSLRRKITRKSRTPSSAGYSRMEKCLWRRELRTIMIFRTMLECQILLHLPID